MPQLPPRAATPHSQPPPPTPPQPARAVPPPTTQPSRALPPLPTRAAAPQRASANSSVDNAIQKIEEFEQNARESAHLADQVSRCIRQVQARLNSLPTKIAASVTENREEVSFERSGRSWSLFYTDFGGEDEHPSKTEATRASLADKIRVVQLIPSLLSDMFSRQKTTLERLRACKPIVEEFAELPDVDDPQDNESDYDTPSLEMSHGQVPF